jgi:hypothetical protein
MRSLIPYGTRAPTKGKEDRESPAFRQVVVDEAICSLRSCVSAAACKKWHLDLSKTTTVNNDHSK